MANAPAERESDTERAWRQTVDRATAEGDDCTQLAGRLAASRREFEADEPASTNRARWVLSGLILIAIPLIVYSGLMTPTDAINYKGLGIGIALMLAGALSYL
ncbi:MAG: hypothetical protein QXG03_00145 [Halalkalicoccus sp.]